MEMFDTLLDTPWVVGLGLVLGGFIGGRILVVFLRPLLSRLARKSEWKWDDLLVDAVATPVCWLLAVQILHGSLPWLPIDPRAASLVASSTALLTTFLVLWAGFRAVDVGVGILSHRSWATERPAARSLLAIGGRLIKGLIVIFSGIVILAHLGVSVASLIAGLGIGGLALALASQKTVEHLFGTLSIGVDQPLREGDFVAVGGHIGTVEEIGLRSTRIRTLDRTLVTVPNGQLADERIESYTARDRIRLACTIGLEYGTRAAQLRAVLAGLEQVLRAQPLIWDESVVVRFQAFGASSLDIEVMAWFQTSDYNEFRAIRQEVLLGFMDVVEANGTSFAFPTQTIHLASSGAPPAAAP